jgi:hypothetical protein
MEPTVEIADALLMEAKRVASAEGTTLRELVEHGLRSVLEQRRRQQPFRLEDASVEGGGLHPDVADASWPRIRDLSYEGRGA